MFDDEILFSIIELHRTVKKKKFPLVSKFANATNLYLAPFLRSKCKSDLAVNEQT
jgi:hypothetical protein